ncbi:MAG: spore gernimation protein [Oscillospiraceae bacterium]|jgi:spore germination protein KB|nr:spore gernimation protein [Oscillospiraceae bacterium]
MSSKRKEVISSSQLICIMVLFIIGSSIVTGAGKESKQDVWISMIAAIVTSIPIYLMYAKLVKLFPDQTIFDMLYTCFGKIGGMVLNVIFILYPIHLGGIVMRNFTDFIQNVSFPETPRFVAAIFIGIVCCYILKHGPEVLGRGSFFALPIVVFTILATLLLTIGQQDFQNIQPVFSQKITDILASTSGLISFPYGEVVLFMSIVPCVEKKSNIKKVYLVSLAIGGTMLLLVLVRNIVVLGTPTMGMLYFPSYTSVSVIDVGDFISRVEVIVTQNFIICGITKTTVCIYAAIKGLERLFNIKDYKVLVAPACFACTALAGWSYASTMEMFQYIEVYKYYAPPLQIGVPIIMLIIGLVKQKKAQLAEKKAQKESEVKKEINPNRVFG